MVKKKIKRNIRIARYVIYKETLVNFKEMLWSFVGAFFGIGIIAFIQSIYLDHWGNIFLIGSFGASSVLVYGATQSPLSQPRNLIVGHLVSAIIGVTIYQFMPHIIWITAPLAVASSIIIMQITKSLHPPGGYRFDCCNWFRKSHNFRLFICYFSCPFRIAYFTCCRPCV